MIRMTLNAFFAVFCFTVALVLTGCESMGLPNATDEFYAGEAATSADVNAFGADEENANESNGDSFDESGANEGEDETGETDTETETETEGGEDFASECLFGTDVADMAQADWLELGDFEHVVGADELTGLETEQLLGGFAEHGTGSVADVDELFERFVDDGRVMVRTVVDVETDATYTHLAFWSQGREKGYLFLEDTLRLMAAVDGGTIYACVVGF